MKECADCKWWRKINNVIGECRRMPPHPADNMEDPRWWPVTKRDDWCGEFKRKAVSEYKSEIF